MANEYRQILFCYIFDQRSNPTVPRELDSEKFLAEQTWSIGRLPPRDDDHRMTHICLHSPFVSSAHAQLRYNEETTFWEIRNVSSTNKTILDGIVTPDSQWVEIREGSKAVFATPQNYIVFSYIKDNTLTPFNDPEPTANVPIGELIVPPPSHPTTDKDHPWQLQLITVLVGGASTLPMPRLVIFLACALAGLAIILILGAAL